MEKNRKYMLNAVYLTILFIAIYLFLHRNYYEAKVYISEKNILNVGILFSKTGTMAESEQPIINAILLAIEEINEKGGINNQQITPIVYDGESNWKKYAELAKKLILQDDVSVIFGCWTSAARKEVKPIVEKYDNLLIYPTQYEGIEESSNIIYLGPTPNQQVLPAVSYAFEYIGKRVFLVGSDYIFSHVENEIIKHEVESRGGEILGEQYILFGSKNVDPIIQDIIAKKPDVIFNTINGDTNMAFFERFYELTKGGQRPPTISFSLPNAGRMKLNANRIAGDYAVWSYTTTEKVPENKAFLKSYKKKYGSIQNINDAAATAYAGVYLWKQAVQEALVTKPAFVRERLLRQSVASPAGVIYIDPKNANAWRTTHISQFNKNGQLDQMWTSMNPIEPVVYPDFKKKTEWGFFEYKLFLKWNKAWQNS